MQEQKKFKGTLEDWDVFVDNKDKDPHFHLVGNLNGSEKLTSRVICINGQMAETENSIYRLGWPYHSATDVMTSRWWKTLREFGRRQSEKEKGDAAS